MMRSNLLNHLIDQTHAFLITGGYGPYVTSGNFVGNRCGFFVCTSFVIDGAAKQHGSLQCHANNNDEANLIIGNTGRWGEFKGGIFATDDPVVTGSSLTGSPCRFIP